MTNSRDRSSCFLERSTLMAHFHTITISYPKDVYDVLRKKVLFEISASLQVGNPPFGWHRLTLSPTRPHRQPATPRLLIRLEKFILVIVFVGSAWVLSVKLVGFVYASIWVASIIHELTNSGNREDTGMVCAGNARACASSLCFQQTSL